VGFPVDCGFLRGLVTRSGEYDEVWDNMSPYPLFDLASILAGLGIDPDISREAFARELIGVSKGRKHHPLWDAEVTGLCLIQAMRPCVEMSQR
jgi:hypothetical protein